MYNPEIKYVILCDHVIQDSKNQKMSVINIIDTLQLPGEVVFPIEFDLQMLVRINNAKGAKSASIRILDANEKEIVLVPFESDEKPNEMDGLNLKAILGRVKFEAVGEYKIEIILDGKELDRGKHSLVIEKHDK